MGLIGKTMSILRRGAVRNHSRRQSQAKAARARAKAAVEANVAEEQAAVIARALQEDEAHGHADLAKVAEEEAEAVPWSRQPTSDGDIEPARDQPKRHAS